MTTREEHRGLEAVTGLASDDLQDQMAQCIAQRRNLETIFNSVEDGILAVDTDLRIVNLNRSAQEITGWALDHAVGASCSDVLCKADGSGACDLRAAVESGRMLDGHEMEIGRRNGGQRSLRVTTHQLQDEDGNPRGVVAILRDMTEIKKLQRALEGTSRFERLIGKNRQMQELYQLIEDVGESDATILILGESGTGKELVAEAIHRRSHRSEGPFVKVNCSALSESLLESELFGHVKGAFTGAIRDKTGRFELADGGTIFLDEIGEISPAVQVKLLRVLQEREFERVGASDTRRVDVRVIAATHRDLKTRMEEGAFREDLYYRLYVVPVELPPLRDRKEDIPLLVSHFVAHFADRTGKDITGLTGDAMNVMMDYDWPGNVRELENAVEHAFVKCRADRLGVEDLPRAIVRDVRGEAPASVGKGMPERDRILAVLEESGWNRSRAAQMLGMHRTTIWRKMKEYGIEDRGGPAV